jgi:thermostable 8-oxoguanine DNA glycosylase
MALFTYCRGEEVQYCDIPDSATELLPGIAWGHPAALFSPAYWYAQHLMSESVFLDVSAHKLGKTLEEEVVACLLGGYGMPAEIGLAAFRRLRDEGLIARLCTDEKLISERLKEPLIVAGRPTRYRFWKQKARYVSLAMRRLQEPIHAESALPLRADLLQVPGIGPKTASWIVRNWLASDDVAILDIHIVRAGIIMGLFSPQERVSTSYFNLEAKFLTFARALTVPPSSLDALIWRLMRRTPGIVSKCLTSLNRSATQQG